jgi:hypothetical protein
MTDYADHMNLYGIDCLFHERKNREEVFLRWLIFVQPPDLKPQIGGPFDAPFEIAPLVVFFGQLDVLVEQEVLVATCTILCFIKGFLNERICCGFQQETNMSTAINSVHEHATTNKQVFFSFTWSYDGTTIDWSGKIFLPNGGSHALNGGKIINVPQGAVEQAVTEEIKRLIDNLDIEELRAD